MLDLITRKDTTAELRNRIAAYLYDQFSLESSSLAGLDRWSQKKVTDENMAKLSLVLEADDSIESCYQNLVREIDAEAECGIYLTRADAPSAALRDLATDSGISGRLNQEMKKIAPALFADELEHSNSDMDLVWVTIEARYDRAVVDAMVSEMIMQDLADDGDSVADMSSALRSLMYSFHEDMARRRSGLPLVLNDRSTRELLTMISELSARGGDYDQRVAEIEARASTF